MSDPIFVYLQILTVNRNSSGRQCHFKIVLLITGSFFGVFSLQLEVVARESCESYLSIYYTGYFFIKINVGFF